MFSAPVTAIKILPMHRVCLAGTEGMKEKGGKNISM